MTDKEFAWRRFQKLAALLRTRQAIPDDLADDVADAIEIACNKDADDRGKVLAFGHELGLLAMNRQPTVSWSPADAELERDFGGEYPSQNAAAEGIAEKAGISKSSAINLLRKARRHKEEEIAWLRENTNPDDV